MAHFEAMGLSSPAPFPLHWHPIITHHITQGDELRLYAAAVLGREPWPSRARQRTLSAFNRANAQQEQPQTPQSPSQASQRPQKQRQLKKRSG